MDIQSAKQVMLRTHIAALKQDHRASGLIVESGPGIGKTEGVFQSCEDLSREINEPVGLVQFMLATISSVDVRGFMLPVRGDGGVLETVFSSPPWYPTIASSWVVEPNGNWYRPGSWTGPIPRVGVLFLDEFGQAEDEVKKPAAELILKGNVGTCELPLGWRVIGAQNRTSDRSGVMRELMFIVNRRCLLSIDPSLPTWLDWANRQPAARQPHYLSISFAQKHPDIVFKDAVPEGTEPFCTPRTLCLMDTDLRAMRSPEDIQHDRLPLDNISRELAAGWIGKGSAAQFYTHLKYADELPDIEDIVKDPVKAKLSDRRDVQMVCAYMVAHHVTEKNAGALLKYSFRMNIEMQVLTIRAISQHPERAKAVVAEPGYTEWLIKNKDLLIASRS